MNKLFVTSALTFTGVAGTTAFQFGKAAYKTFNGKELFQLTPEQLAGKEPVYTDAKGKNHFFLGYFGAGNEVFKNNALEEDQRVLSLNQRDLFYGPEEVAKRYAIMGRDRTNNDHGSVGIVTFTEKRPTTKDHGPQWFEGGYAPLSSEGQKNCGIYVVTPRPMKKAHLNSISSIAARAYRAVTQQGLSKTLEEIKKHL